jgi:hypothetical protein
MVRFSEDQYFDRIGVPSMPKGEAGKHEGITGREGTSKD